MPKLPAVKPKQVIRALERAGFIFERQKGSHKLYTKEKRAVTISCHNKEMKPKTLQSVIKQSGLELEEFVNLL